MKKMLFVLGLLTSSSALACPIKKGYIANGLIKNIYSTEILAPVCGELRDYVASNVFSTMKWTELYGVKNTNGGKLQIATIQRVMTHMGYRKVASQAISKGTMWRFDKGSKTIMMMTSINDPLILVSIAGN